MYDIAICDDQLEDRLFLKERIEANGIGCTEVRIHEYVSGEELLEGIENTDISMVFLYIRLGGMDGEETALRMREGNSDVILVFYSEFPYPTPESLEVQPFRYIAKSMPIEKIDEYIESAVMQMILEKQKPALMVKSNRNQYRINLGDIVYIEKYLKGSRIHITPNRYGAFEVEPESDGNLPVLRMTEKLDQLYDKLRRYGFGCPHDSYILNFKYVNCCLPKEVQLEYTDHSLPIARGKSKEFLQELAYYCKFPH